MFFSIYPQVINTAVREPKHTYTHIPRLSVQVFKSCLPPLTHRDLAEANPANQNTEHWDLAALLLALLPLLLKARLRGLSAGSRLHVTGLFSGEIGVTLSLPMGMMGKYTTAYP